MHSQVGWLSKDAHDLQLRLAEENKKSADVPDSGLHCDLLIVGSGYGGAVAAARLAETKLEGKPLRVIVLERGREYLAGMFPSRLADLPGHVRVSRQDGEPPRGPATALWDMRLGKDVNVVLGSGLGGGSLINAAVMARPEASVWESGWPSQIDGGLLEASYAKAEHMLGANPLPNGQTLPKLEALQHLGDGLPDKPKVERCNLAISFKDNKTPEAQVQQKACKLCGDCATGCNWQAKNSLDANYLALARRRNVDMYCGVLAHRIERQGKDGWKLLWAPTDDSLGWASQALPIHTRFLIICAGSLGSTELLQRSQSDEGKHDETDEDATRLRLQFSTALGSRFSTNGDMLAAAVKLPMHTQMCADETDAIDGRNIGPTITGMLRSGEGGSRFVAQEFAIPAPLRTLLSELTGSLDMLQGMARFDWSLHSPWQRGAEPLSPNQHDLDRTMVYGLMGDDGAFGRLEPTRPVADDRRSAAVPAGNAAPPARVSDGRIAVQWPEARYEHLFDAQHAAFSAAYGSNVRGWYLPNPGWRPLPDALDRLAQGKGVRGPLTTVHPLGGCPMGASVAQGVVDWAGRVFNNSPGGEHGGKFMQGLVVLDGSIIPRSLGINPALTIAALAEHAVPELIRDWGLELGDSALTELARRPVWDEPSPRPEQPSTGIRLMEKVQGTLEMGDRAYWGEMEVRFAPIADVATFARKLPRQALFENVVLRLYADRRQRDDEPQWRGQRDVDVAPLFELQLSGSADVMFRHWSWFGCRVYRGFMNVTGTGAGSHLPLSTQLAIASNIGERRGIDYLLHVDSVSHPACPLKPGDRLRGRKVIDNDLASNPWRQVSEMEFQLRSGAGLFGVRYRRIGRLDLDLRYFVRQRTALLALSAQPDMVTALADLATLGVFCLRVLLKIQLLKFVPPEKRQRDIAARRPAELPGLTIERFDLRERRRSKKVLLTRYTSQVGPTKGWPIVLLHGFTASGSTFAHPTIQPNLVQYLCAERRDVWVAELSTSIAFEKREAKDLSFEEVADEIPVVLAFVKLFTKNQLADQTADVRLDVLGHCIGAAMFCRAVLRHTSLYRMVNSLTLSQVGPLIEMSPANQLRGYMASYLAQFLGVKTLDARPSFEPGGAEGLGQVLLDAVLASLPYPERDHERMLGQQAVDEGRPDFRLVRHRADAMLGRLFELTDDSTVAPDTLDQLDDILGYARVQTLAQIIHYTRLSMLTDSDGRNREVNNDAMARRMRFPVLLLHGRRSGVFDWRGSLESYEWLRNSRIPALNPADARVLRNDEKLHIGLDTTRQLCIFEKFGHQDTMIGSRAADVVFPVIGEFLRWVDEQKLAASRDKLSPGQQSKTNDPTTPPAPAGAITGTRAPAPWVARVPWIGPIVGWLRDSKQRNELEVSLVIRPNPMHTRTRFVALVQMRRQNGTWQPETGAGKIKLWDDFTRQPTPVFNGALGGGYQLAMANVQPFHALPISNDAQSPRPAASTDDDGAVPSDALAEEDSDGFAEGKPKDPIGDHLRQGSITLRLDPRSADGVSTALLLLTVHDDLPRRRDKAEPDPELAENQPSGNPAAQRDRRHAEAAVKRYLADPPAGLEAALLRLPAHVVAAKDRFTPAWKSNDRADALTFAVASCQYPAGLLDRDLAQSSYRRLLRRIDAPIGLQRLPLPQLLLLLGDQVYVDEMAGLFEPVTKDLAFDQIYDRNLGLPAFRAITSRLPTFMMLDDHEVRDNWQPPDGTMSDDDRHALQNFHDRQAGLNRRRPSTANASYSFRFAPGGWPVFVLDTRTQRMPRTPENFDTATIIPELEVRRLLECLTALDADDPGCPKFIATPSVLLPFERDPKQRRWSSDGWAGFPASRRTLLDGIARNRISNVIFLSGDAHLSMASKVDLFIDGQKRVTVHSVVSSGLYAPWRFANSERCEYVPDGLHELTSELSCDFETQTFEANGYAVVHVERTDDGYRLIAEFDTSAGVKRQEYGLPSA